MIEGLHHSAYRCRDIEETRSFYEDFLGLPLVNAFELSQTKTGSPTRAIHAFFSMADGSCLAFFEVPNLPFEFKAQHDFDLHIALEVPRRSLESWLRMAKAAGVECRGIADHEFMESIYLRDPNGYVVELCSKRGNHADAMDPSRNGARENLDVWQRSKAG